MPKNVGTVIVKHANPCGVSIKLNHLESYKLALACDPVSAFGGIVSCNFKITKNLALELNKLFLEVIIANDFDAAALKILKTKKNLRLIDASNYSFKEVLKFSSLNEEILVQSEDTNKFNIKNFKVVSKKKPNALQMKNLIFAFNVCRYVKSNAIVLATNEATIGIGSGQPSRLDSCQIAIDKMKKFTNTNGEMVAASDAFFPFVDGIEKLRFISHNEEILIQSQDVYKFNKKDFEIVSKKKPNSQQMKNLIFAFNICRYVKSNAIVLVTNETTAGIGSGQPSRLDSCQIAINKMKKFISTDEEIVAASDAFFPFVDGIEKLVQSGVTAVIQPYGSMRDKEIINYANQTNTILVFSKTRHFRH